MLASLLFPYDDDAKKHIDTWLGELSSESCITRYAVDGDQYIQINKWTSHQKIDKPSASKLPEPPSIREDSRGFASLPENSLRKGMEGNGVDGNGTSCSEPQAASEPEDESAVFISIPLTGDKVHSVTENKVAYYRELYPAVNVEQELRKMVGWCDANPSKRKTPKGIATFIASWLSKAQDSPRSGNAQQPQQSFRERDAQIGRKRWEEMTGQIHPENLSPSILDIFPSDTLEIVYEQSH